MGPMRRGPTVDILLLHELRKKDTRPQYLLIKRIKFFKLISYLTFVSLKCINVSFLMALQKRNWQCFLLLIQLFPNEKKNRIIALAQTESIFEGLSNALKYC